MTATTDSLAQANRAVLVLLLVCCALLATVVFLLLRPSPADAIASVDALRDSAIRARVVARLAGQNSDIYDSHTDAEVGRILLPGLDHKRSRDILVSTNGFGLRERAYALPKPAGVVRVVLLGDSFVFGYGVAAEERFGVHLERWLSERSGNDKLRVECLHIGVSSWNFKSEAAYLRRQLSNLAPDLVIHLSLPNDLHETVGVRGFGGWSSFSPQKRSHADSVISAAFGRRELGFSRPGYLLHGLDYESQSRYAEAVSDLSRLAAALEQAGAGYRLLFHHRHLWPVTWRYLGSQLNPSQILFISEEFGNDRRYWNSAQDLHWNPAGHRQAAQMLFGLIVRDHLLPKLELEPWAAAEQLAAQHLWTAERVTPDHDQSPAELLHRYGRPRIAAAIDFAQLDEYTASQIHGGVDRDRQVSPYASILLRNENGRRLRLLGHSFPRPELDGAVVRVFVDAHQVGQIKLRTDTPIRESFQIPASLRNREFLSVRLESSDYVYVGLDLQHCVVFWLRELAIES